MAENVELIKEVRGRSTYGRVVDTSFKELYKPPTPPSVSEDTSVETFFDLYNQLFFKIPATGEVNSHEYLVARSLAYLGGPVVSDVEKAYIDEINSLKQQLLEMSENYMSLNKIV